MSNSTMPRVETDLLSSAAETPVVAPPFGNDSATRPTLQDVDISDIHIDPHLQVRADVDQDLIDEYARAMKDGAVFPPVRIVVHASRYRLVDGRHRLEAAKKIGVKAIAAEIIAAEGPIVLATAIKFNTSHGRQLSNQEKRNALERLLRDAVAVAWSDNTIAKATGVSGTFVAKVRHGIFSRTEDRERVVSRAGKTYTMDTTGIGAKKAQKASPNLAGPVEIPSVTSARLPGCDDSSNSAAKTCPEQPAVSFTPSATLVDVLLVEIQTLATAWARMHSRVGALAAADRPALNSAVQGMLHQVKATASVIGGKDPTHPGHGERVEKSIEDPVPTLTYVPVAPETQQRVAETGTP